MTAPKAAISHRVLSPSPRELGTRMGMAWFAAAAGELIAAPIAGALANVQTGYYTLAQAVPGAIMIYVRYVCFGRWLRQADAIDGTST